MPYNVVLVPSFHRDAWSVFSYISQRLGAPQAAERLLEEAERRAQRLADFPTQGKIFVLSDGTQTKYRRINVRNYAMFYRINEETHTVEIHRFIYGRRNLELLLK